MREIRESPLPLDLAAPRVRLFALTEQHLPARVPWTMDEELSRLMGVDPQAEPFESAEQALAENRHWLRLRHLQGARVYGIEAEGRYIGDVDVDIEPVERLGQMTVFIGDRAAWGKGYGTEAVDAVLHVLFHDPPPKPVRLDEPPPNEDDAFVPMESVVVSVAAGNDRARRFWEKLGFEEYGADEAGTRFLRLERAAYLRQRKAPK